MKKLLFALTTALLIVFTTACGSETTEEAGGDVAAETESEGLTVEIFEDRVEDALNQMGEETNLAILSSEINEDGKHVISLSENIFIFVTTDDDDKVVEATLAAMPDALSTENEDLKFSFLLLPGSIDNSLNAGERSAIVSELGLNDANLFDHVEVYKRNDINYTFMGTEENILFQAELN